MTAPPSTGELQINGRPASWVRAGRLDGRPLLLLAHGAGAPLTSVFMEHVALGLVERGLAVVRFQFPYMEARARSGKGGPPDREPVLLATWKAMIEHARAWAGPLVLGGKSLGGRMASVLLAREGDLGVLGAVYLGYPLHPPGRKDKLRSEHLPQVPVPQLFVSGTKDNLCDLTLLAPVLERMEGRATLHIVERGDHSLATSRSDPMKGSAVWLDVVAAFVKGLGPKR